MVQSCGLEDLTEGQIALIVCLLQIHISMFYKVRDDSEENLNTIEKKQKQKNKKTITFPLPSFPTPKPKLEFFGIKSFLFPVH